jgi:hypothetical protein
MVSSRAPPAALALTSHQAPPTATTTRTNTTAAIRDHPRAIELIGRPASVVAAERRRDAVPYPRQDYAAFRECMSIEKRYFTSDLSIRS